MNRGDLAWALSAVIPHAGKTDATGIVGLERHGDALFAYATDRYSTGIARIRQGTDLDVRLPSREATELMRFVRPGRVAEYDHDVSYAVQPREFHVGLMDDDDLIDSAVFDLTDSPLSLSPLLAMIRTLDVAPVEYRDVVFQPGLVAKFAKAQRADTDRLRILPRHVIDRNGAAVVTVGTDFIGAIAGLTYDDLGAATVADLLQIA